MSDSRIQALLEDAVADVEPGDRLAAIRSRARRTRRGLWIPAGAALVAASVVAAFALGGRPGEDVAEPGPADTPSVAPSPSGDGSPTASSTDGETRAVPAYYVGDTPDGPRLFRELRDVAAPDPLSAAMQVLSEPPLDADYRTLWPAGAIADVSFDGIGEDGLFGVRLTDASYRDRPANMSPVEAGLAVEQVIHTLQAGGTRAPVLFSLGGNPIDQVLGVPTAEPLAEGPVLETLAHVSISEPSEGQLVDNDEPFVVSGLGNSFEGNIVTRIQRWEGTEVVAEKPAIAGWGEERLFPWEVTFGLADVAPGEYAVISRTDDPSGQGRFHTDTRRITVVD